MRLIGSLTLPEGDRPSHSISETWKGAGIAHGAAAAWFTGVYDARTGTIFWQTGNPASVLIYLPPFRNETARLPLEIVAVVLVWMAAVGLCCGMTSFRVALFPLCCLLFMVPLPLTVIDRITIGLQHASAAASYAILRLVGVPVFRQGMTFVLPGVSIEIAPECSGIRSCLAFTLAAVVASHVCLRSGWRKLALIVLTIPIAIFKNAVRIVVISWMSVYIDKGFLDSPLHHQGGPVFALVGLALFVPLLFALQRSETPAQEKN